MEGGGGASLRPIAALAIIGLAVTMLSSAASADTLDWALVQAYQNNPTLNAQRAAGAGRGGAAGAVRLSSAGLGHRVDRQSIHAHADKDGPRLYRYAGRHDASLGRRDGDADAVQRFPDRPPPAPG